MRNIEVISPRTLNEALSILKDEVDGVYILGGGTDLIIRIKERRIKPRILLDLSRIEELHFIEEEKDHIRIGAMTKIEEILDSETVRKYAIPLHDSAKVFGSVQIRNLATIGGNIVNASPVAETVPPLFVLQAKLILKSARGEREISIEDFSTGPGESVIERDEILKEIYFQKMKENECGFYKKLGQRKALAISKVSVAFLGCIESGIIKYARIALGAVAPKVIRAKRAEEFLKGKKLEDSTIKEASLIASSESSPITDLRSTDSYRRDMVASLLYMGLIEL
jgi:CO/xanthine dehydrogenase FAD-binding subunit